jgi:hypothetical protein
MEIRDVARYAETRTAAVVPHQCRTARNATMIEINLRPVTSDK